MRHDTFHAEAAGKRLCGAQPNGRRSALGKSLRKIHGTLTLWHARAQSRRELEHLDDRLLRDAGLDRTEANKPFWRA